MKPTAHVVWAGRDETGVTLFSDGVTRDFGHNFNILRTGGFRPVFASVMPLRVADPLTAGLQLFGVIVVEHITMPRDFLEEGAESR